MSKVLTVNELFSGIGTQAFALEYLGIPHKVVGMAEIEKNAIEAYNILHGETRNYGDISKIDKLDYADLWTYSFPCFTGDTPILTKNGYVRIDEIEVGDEVYTHTGNLRKVVNTFDNGLHKITKVRIDTVGFPIETTSNHKFYVIHNDILDWVEAKDIRLDSYACIIRRGENKNLPKEDIPEELLNVENIEELSKLFIFRKILSVNEYDYELNVYDIEVEEDHSFCITDGVVVHNCQDLSAGGKGKGIAATDENGNKVATRSGLLWEVERLLAKSCGYDIIDGLLVKNDKYEINPPKYLLLENVPELVDRKRHKKHFEKWLYRLKELGYVTSHGKLNGSDFGVPQNRNRVFCLSVREDVYSKEVDFPAFTSSYFPPINVGFEDFVDKEVREYDGPLMIDPAISGYLLPAYTRDLPYVAACSEDPLNATDIWTCECKSGFQDHRIGIRWAPTIRHQNSHTAIFYNNQIHKLTACECWKFMGIKEKDFWKVKNNSKMSDNILCGLAGNAIVVPVLMSLFNQIWLIETRGYPNGPNVITDDITATYGVPFYSVDVNEK